MVIYKTIQGRLSFVFLFFYLFFDSIFFLIGWRSLWVAARVNVRVTLAGKLDLKTLRLDDRLKHFLLFYLDVPVNPVFFLPTVIMHSFISFPFRRFSFFLLRLPKWVDEFGGSDSSSQTRKRGNNEKREKKREWYGPVCWIDHTHAAIWLLPIQVKQKAKSRNVRR